MEVTCVTAQKCQNLCYAKCWQRQRDKWLYLLSILKIPCLGNIYLYEVTEERRKANSWRKSLLFSVDRRLLILNSVTKTLLLLDTLQVGRINSTAKPSH